MNSQHIQELFKKVNCYNVDDFQTSYNIVLRNMMHFKTSMQTISDNLFYGAIKICYTSYGLTAPSEIFENYGNVIDFLEWKVSNGEPEEIIIQYNIEYFTTLLQRILNDTKQKIAQDDIKLYHIQEDNLNKFIKDTIIQKKKKKVKKPVKKHELYMPYIDEEFKRLYNICKSPAYRDYLVQTENNELDNDYMLLPEDNNSFYDYYVCHPSVKYLIGNFPISE